MNNNILKLRIYCLICLLFLIVSSSCINQNNKSKANYYVQVNDSLSVNLFFNDSNGLRTLLIRNSNTNDEIINGYHENGNISVHGIEHNGKREGDYLTYYSNGMLNSKIEYKNGQKNGEHMIYSEEGNRIYHAYYTNGKCDSTVLDKRDIMYEFEE